MQPLCRDCLSLAPAPKKRCAHCGSPRLLTHAERDALAIAHIDCDAFYAAVEKRDRPELADQPVIIGGGKRGVVSTACYIARTYGVRSAMPMFKARALCPQAVIVKPDMAKYAAVGREIRRRMLSLTPLVEPLSIDEAFLDLTGADRLHGAPPAITLAKFAQEIEREVGLSVSIGLSYCKFLAKLASDLDKPRGFSIIGRAEAQSVLAPMSVGKIWGVGAVARRRLETQGLATIGDLQQTDEIDLIRLMGSEGQRLARLARGDDPRRVSPDRETKSVSAETTFETDLSAPDALVPVLYALTEKVSRRLKAQGFAAGNVTVKLKTADFKTRTRAQRLPATQLAARLFPVARELLLKELDGARFRLLGVGAGDLRSAEEADAPDLAEPDLEKTKAREQAMDALRAKFGNDAIVKGVGFAAPPRKPQR